MIPKLNKLGIQERDANDKPIWIRTKADMELFKYKDVFGFYIDNRWFPLYSYIEAYERIVDRNGKVSVFQLNDSQIALYKAMAEMKLETGNVRLNDGKARQMGGSTLISGMFFALTCFNPGMSCGIIADTQEHGQGLLDKYKMFYETTPEFIKSKLNLVVDNANEMIFDFGHGIKSTFKVVVAGLKAGRSAHFNMLHESEVATWQDIMATIGALDATVSDGDPNSIIVRETTAQGVNEWKMVFDSGMAHRGTYRSLFVPWYMESSYRHKWRVHDMNDYEKKLYYELNLEYDQIQWWRDTWENYQCDYTIMGKEYPTTPSEMFLNSGNSFFNSKIVANRKDELLGVKPIHEWLFGFERSVSQDGHLMEIKNIKRFDQRNGGTMIYKEPLKGHPYILNIDPAGGGLDYYAGVICDNYTCEQVAVFHRQGKTIDSDEAIWQLYCLYDYYKHGKDGDMENRVLVSYENNIDVNIGKTFEELGVRDIYIDQSKDTFSERYADRYGYRTDITNRRPMIDMFKIAFREHPSMVNDYETICEMEGFQNQPSGREGKEKAMAMAGFHDDLIMAMAGFFWVRGSFPCLIQQDPPKRKKLGFDPFSKEKTLEEDNVFMRWD